MKKIVMLVFALMLSACATLGGPQWLNHPLFSLSITLHDKKGESYLDKDGVCHVFMPFTKEGVATGIDDQLEACVKAGGGKVFASVKRAGVKHFRFYPVQSSHEVGQRSFDLTKVRVNPNKAVCVHQCEDVAFIKPRGDHCIIVYNQNDLDHWGRKEKSTLSHEIFHGFVGDYHKNFPFHRVWHPKEKWSSSGMHCG